jgi:hypothetical protein
MSGSALKSAYVAGARAARRAAEATGVKDALDRRRDSRTALFLRSLLAIHDIEDMIRLDVPWWTFGSIEAIERFIRSRSGQVRVFEFGPGASTFWLSRRCSSVAFVEHDAQWWSIFGPLVARLPNASGVLAEPKRPSPGTSPRCASGREGWTGLDFAEYVAAIRTAGGPFDIVVVDGRARDSCLREAENCLAPGGMIVFDNSNRARYRKAIESSPLRKTRYDGLAPALPYPSQTTILTQG